MLDTVREWLQDEQIGKLPMLQLLAAQIFFEEKNCKEALRLATQDVGDNLEKYGNA